MVGSFSLREATVSDTASLFGLLTDFAHTFEEDGRDLFTPKEAMEAGPVYMVDYYGFPVGAFLLTDMDEGLHASIHLLLRPEYMRRALRSGILIEFVDTAFSRYDLVKLKARALANQGTAIKLLKRHRFFSICKLWNETRVNGKPTDLYLFELNRRYWDKTGREAVSQDVIKKGT